MEQVTRPLCKCRKCGWSWIADTEDLPRRCANSKCRSPYWQDEPIVYVLRWNNNLVKIGATSNLKQRYGMRVQVIAAFPCASRAEASELESALHTLFAPKKTAESRETFVLDEADVSSLVRLADDPKPLVKVKEWLSQ